MYHMIAFLIFILLFLSEFYNNLKNSKAILSYLLFGLFIMASIRYNIGTDYSNYFILFKELKPFSFHPNYSVGYEYYEPLFRYTVAILKNLISSPIFYFSFWAFISLFFIWKGIKERSVNYLLSVFLFYCHFYVNYTFNGIRQGITMGIFLFSLRYIINRQFPQVFFISIFSSLIHSSGLFILFSYFMSMIKFNRRSTLFLLLFISILFWKIGVGEKIFTLIALQFQGYIPNLVVYIRLFLYDHTFTNILQRLLLIIPLIYFYPILSKNTTYQRLFSIYFLATLIYFFFGFFGLFITRVNMFFRILEIILIPILYENIRIKSQKIIIQIAIMLWGFIILTWVYHKEAYYPFKTIFGNIV